MFVDRREDMSARGFLRLFAEDDGDMCITVMDQKGRCASIQFCSVGAGGGRSPKTIQALRKLFKAMREDNASGEREDARVEFDGDVSRFP